MANILLSTALQGQIFETQSLNTGPYNVSVGQSLTDLLAQARPVLRTPGRIINVNANLNPIGAALGAPLDIGLIPAGWTQPVAGKRADVVADASGQRYLKFVAANSQYYAAGGYAGISGLQVWSALSRFNCATVGADQNIFGASGAGTWLCQMYVSAANKVEFWLRDAAGNIAIVNTTALVGANEDHTAAWVQNGTSSFVVLDGVAVNGNGTNTIVGPIALTAVQLGATSAAGANFFNGRIYGAQMYNRALQPQDYINEYFALNGHTPLRVICDGNSLTAATYPADLAGLLGANALLVSNLGVGAATTEARIAAFAAPGGGFPLCQPWSQMVAIPWEFGNSILAGDTFDTVVALMLEWLSMYRAGGCKVILIDVPARTSFSVANNTVVAQFNDYCKYNWQSFADGFVPASQYFHDPTGPLYGGDGIHFSVAGYQLLANLLYPIVLDLAVPDLMAA